MKILIMVDKLAAIYFILFLLLFFFIRSSIHVGILAWLVIAILLHYCHACAGVLLLYCYCSISVTVPDESIAFVLTVSQLYWCSIAVAPVVALMLLFQGHSHNYLITISITTSSLITVITGPCCLLIDTAESHWFPCTATWQIKMVEVPVRLEMFRSGSSTSMFHPGS